MVQDQLEDQIVVCFASLFCDKCGDLTPDMSGQPLECTQASLESTQAQPESEPSEPVGTLRRSETSDLNDNKGDETQLMVPLSAEEVKRARSLQAAMLRQLGNPGNRNRDSGLASFISVPRSWKAGTPVPGLPDHLQPDARATPPRAVSPTPTSAAPPSPRAPSTPTAAGSLRRSCSDQLASPGSGMRPVGEDLVCQLVGHAFKIKWEPPSFTVMNSPTPEDQVDNNFVLRGEFQVLGFCLPAYVAFKDFHARADPTVMQQLNACIGAESDRPPAQVAAAAASRPGSRSPRRRVTPWVRVRPNDVAIDVEDSPAKASASASATVSATVPDSMSLSQDETQQND